MLDTKPQIKKLEEHQPGSMPTSIPRHVIFKVEKIKDKENNPGRSQSEKILFLEEQDKNYIHFSNHVIRKRVE